MTTATHRSFAHYADYDAPTRDDDDGMFLIERLVETTAGSEAERSSEVDYGLEISTAEGVAHYLVHIFGKDIDIDMRGVRPSA